jgi:hypothetical protein
LSPSVLVPRPWFQGLRAPSEAHHPQAVAGAFASAVPLSRLNPPHLGEPSCFEPAPQGSSPTCRPSDLREETRSFHGVPATSGRRSGALRCSTPKGTGMPPEAESFQGLPQKTPGAVTRSARPSRVTELSKRQLLGQLDRRLRLACPNRQVQRCPSRGFGCIVTVPRDVAVPRTTLAGLTGLSEAPPGVAVTSVHRVLRVVSTTTRCSADRPSVRSEDRPAAPTGFVALSGFGPRCPPRSCLTGSPLLGFHAPPATPAEGSVSPGPTSPGTFRPRGFSPPRRLALPPASRTR